MARMDIEFPDNIFEGLEGLFDEAAPKMIDAALPVYKDAVEGSLKKSISQVPEDVKRQTGGLAASLSGVKAKRSKTDAYVGAVIFSGKDAKGSPNIVKAMGLEFGNTHQTARPFLQRATDSCGKEVTDIMQDIFNREAGK